MKSVRDVMFAKTNAISVKYWYNDQFDKGSK